MCVLYSIGCPKCDVLAKKLDAANIEYEVVSDIERLDAEGIDYVPVLEVDGMKMEFSEAVKWVNKQKGQTE
jgi:hypothetical protein